MNAPDTVAVVAGSGLDLHALLDRIDEERDFSKVDGLRDPAISGHPGKFVFGQSEGARVIVQCGRSHFYEALDYETVTAPVVALHAFGARTVLFSNAAGGLLPQMRPGDLMAVDLVRCWPYVRWANRPESLPLDLVPENCDWRGAYHWVHGPCYETRAEIAALRSLHGAAVGMSTAPEVLRARELGMRTGAISCITNNCCTPQVLTHDHVLRTAAAASARLCAALRGVLRSGAHQARPAPEAAAR
jgi:purine-nucleoside phosphorylase